MVRPVSTPGGRPITLRFRVSETGAALIEQARGDRTLSDYLRGLVADDINRRNGEKK